MSKDTVAVAGGSWFSRLWDRLRGKRSAPAPGGIPAAPLTLVARVSAVEEAREREMLRLAEESIRRGHPEQAAIVYRKAAERYRAEGKASKELASLNLWARVAPLDPEVWTAIADLHAAAERRRPALEALTRAAALRRQQGDDARAEMLEARIQDLRATGSASADLSPEPEPSPGPEPSAEPALPVAPSPLRVSVDVPRDDDAAPIELDIPQTGAFEAVDAASAVPEAMRPRVEEPERLPTGALSALDAPDAPPALEASDMLSPDALDGEPEPLSARALEVEPDEAAPEPERGSIEDTETEPGPTFEQTRAALASPAASEDEIPPELMAELTAMADEDTGDEGAATIAMPAIGAQARRGFGIPDAATVMDPGGLPPAARAEVSDVEEEADDEYEDDGADPDTRTRGYSAEELAELDRLLKEKGRR